MTSKLSVLIAALALLITHSAQAATAFITFDDLPQGPMTFPEAMPSPQTITYPQATFSGGAILGYATYFPAQGFATAPNIYGTAWFGDNLLETMTITINPSFPTSEVSFSLFNGVIPSQAYTVSAFNASDTLLISQQYVIPGNGNTGFAIVDLAGIGNCQGHHYPGWRTQRVGLCYRFNYPHPTTTLATSAPAGRTTTFCHRRGSAGISYQAQKKENCRHCCINKPHPCPQTRDAVAETVGVRKRLAAPPSSGAAIRTIGVLDRASRFPLPLQRADPVRSKHISTR